ncbi:Lipopolysaccharide biosynthesis protein WzxC [subsurface metagenome]
MEDLRRKVIRSGFWSLGGNWLSRGLGIIKMIVLARLLSPLDFGILGLAILSINVLNVFSETGIESALIQRDKIGRTELDTAWTIMIIRGLVLFAVLFLSAGWFAAYFDNVTLKPVLKVIAATFLLGGCTNVGIVFFQKELEFKKKVFLDITADVAGAVTAISLAFWLRNVWALVLGSIVWVIVKCLGSFRMHLYRPRIRWDWPMTKNLMNFGKHIFWITLMTFVVTSGDDALVGKLLGLTILGFYTMAYNIANVPVASLAGVVGKISFPAYSILQNEPERLKEAFKKVFEAVMIILLPLTGLIFLLAQDFTAVCLGEKWLPMVPALKILCLLGLFRGLTNVFAALHLAVNRPNIQSRNKTIELVAFLILVYPLTLNWGLVGVSWGVTIVYGISALINAFDTSRLLRPLWTIMANAFVFPLGILAILLVIFLAVRSFIPLEMDLWRFFSSAFLSLMAYGGTLVLFKRQLLKDILSAL